MSRAGSGNNKQGSGAAADLPALDQPPPPPSSGMSRRNPGMHGVGNKISSINSVGSGNNNSQGPTIIRPAASNLSQGTSISQQHQTLSVERSPLPPMILRSLGDRSNEKRKNASPFLVPTQR